MRLFLAIDLPDSVRHVITHGAPANRVTSLSEDVRTQIETPWVVYGTESISITIKDPDKTFSAAP